MTRGFLLIVICVCLSGCLHPKKYNLPAPPVPAAWPQAASGESGAEGDPATVTPPWREFFADAKLQAVIDQALHNNRDLRMAALNVERVQALYRIQRAEQFPTVSVSATGDLYRIPGQLMFAGMTVPQAVTMQQYNVNLGAASWELDLFGRIRSLKTQALEQYLATEQAKYATQIALVSAVANSYLALAADRDNLRLAHATLDAQQSSYELIKQTRDAGMASDLELNQAKSQVETARGDIARFSGQVELDENAINLLVGSPVAADLLPDALATHERLPELSSGMPSEVLLRRPDILMAEHQLRAAYANIGAARAAYFPRIALTGGIGLMSSDLTELFTSGAKTWNFAPQVALPLFDGGARKSTLKVSEVDRDVSIAEYEKAIQTAFREVSDSLILRARLLEQENAQEALVQSLDDTYRLSDARYKAGMDSYLSVLVAQRSLYGAQQGLISLRLARLSNRVTLYKVLGGGA